MPQRRVTLDEVAERPLRVRSVAKAILVTGLAAAALALFAMATTLPPADQHSSETRAKAGVLLLSAAAQVVAAELALLVPKRAVAWLACVVTCRTQCHTYPVIWRIVHCGQGHGALDLSYWIFCVLQNAALAVFNFIAIFGEEY
ncbi:hypothetical protein EJB05_46249 [Eragrostis curvula]|uniref:Uncharacterized protein n=1 Tax=Eragrostis curvula TaxID=38414 RepID=A0A5J9TNZ9_9POAL|nr:hypothetical protein EJB05_46249 [Eragrostis curvula]